MGAKTTDSGEDQKPKLHKAVNQDNNQQIPDRKKHQDQGVCSDQARNGPSVYQNGTSTSMYLLTELTYSSDDDFIMCNVFTSFFSFI